MKSYKTKYLAILVFLFIPFFASAASTDPIFRAIIFDCDGVLVDTEYLKYLSWKESLEPYGVKFTLEEYMPLVGNSSEYIFEKIKTSKNADISMNEVIKKKREIYTKLQAKGVPSITSAVKFAKKLAAEKNSLNIKLALASSAPHAEIMRNLETVGLENAFDVIISGDDDLKDIKDKEGTNKPKPYIYQRLATWLKVKPEDCLVFEDSGAGVIAAHDAGMSVYAVPNRYTAHQDFSKASQVIKSLSMQTYKELFK